MSTRYSDRIEVCGNNQAGTRICSDFINTPNYWTPVGGWWWQGTVEVWGKQYDGPNGTPVYRYATCYVPKSQSGDWTSCDLAGDL